MEAQHIAKFDRFQAILGARLQFTELDQNISQVDLPVYVGPPIGSLAFTTGLDSVGSRQFELNADRQVVYGYVSYQASEKLDLIAGLTWDHFDSPADAFTTPIGPEIESTSQLSPKLGFIFTPQPELTVRASYGRSLSGFELDDQQRLEPSQVAGFVHHFSNAMSSNLLGSIPGSSIESANIAVDYQTKANTYWGFEVNWIHSEVDRDQSFYEQLSAFPDNPGEVVISQYQESIDYSEVTAIARVDQFLGQYASVGANVSISRSWLERKIDNFPFNQSDSEATLYRGQLYGRVNLPNGWFAMTDIQYWKQQNDGSASGWPDQSFPLLNTTVGYRFKKEFGEISLSALNIMDEEISLNPLNYFNQPPHERTFILQLRFGF